MDADREFAHWVATFETRAERRAAGGDPAWATGANLHPAVARSLQRFQVGEDGDGASLLGKAARADDADYFAAAHLFVQEEQGHARLLKDLLASAGLPVLDGHWSDRIFIALRRASGLRLELMTLMTAEVVALRYYRAVRDGTADPLLSQVGARILADEERHVPFHCERLRQGFRHLPQPARVTAAAGWWILLLGAVVIVALDHGPALRQLGVGRAGFVTDVARLFRGVVADVFGRRPALVDRSVGVT